MDYTERYRRGDCQRNERKPPIHLKITAHHNANIFLFSITKKIHPKTLYKCLKIHRKANDKVWRT